MEDYYINSMQLRARRIPVRAKLRYRAYDSWSWHEGTTENISKSGLLFCSENHLDRGERIQIIVTMPAETAGERPKHLACLGLVVRAEPCESAKASYLVAARMLNYQFVRKDS